MYKINSNITKVLAIFITSIISTACYGVPELPSYGDRPDTQKRNAIAVIDLTTVNSIRIIKADKYHNTKQRKEYILRKNSKFLGIRTENYNDVVYVLEPGVYYISKLYYTSGVAEVYTVEKGLSSSGRVTYGAFEVKAGEVAYFGDIKFNYNRNMLFAKLVYGTNRPVLEIENNIDAAAASLRESKKHRHLASRLKKKRFYMAGSKISIDKNGVAHISGA